MFLFSIYLLISYTLSKSQSNILIGQNYISQLPHASTVYKNFMNQISNNLETTVKTLNSKAKKLEKRIAYFDTDSKSNGFIHFHNNQSLISEIDVSSYYLLHYSYKLSEQIGKDILYEEINEYQEDINSGNSKYRSMHSLIRRTFNNLLKYPYIKHLAENTLKEHDPDLFSSNDGYLEACRVYNDDMYTLQEVYNFGGFLESEYNFNLKTYFIKERKEEETEDRENCNVEQQFEEEKNMNLYKEQLDPEPAFEDNKKLKRQLAKDRLPNTNIKPQKIYKLIETNENEEGSSCDDKTEIREHFTKIKRLKECLTDSNQFENDIKDLDDSSSSCFKQTKQHFEFQPAENNENNEFIQKISEIYNILTNTQKSITSFKSEKPKINSNKLKEYKDDAPLFNTTERRMNSGKLPNENNISYDVFKSTLPDYTDNTNQQASNCSDYSKIEQNKNNDKILNSIEVTKKEALFINFVVKTESIFNDDSFYKKYLKFIKIKMKTQFKKELEFIFNKKESNKFKFFEEEFSRIEYIIEDKNFEFVNSEDGIIQNK
eukprot:GAHX01002049.1.p1 GENE.GAHX01002049.1~~GAHX01002049.1.p1  ORF type:complete len:545 (-),score=140.76 GAHX01002049.1:295-1929(-)